MRSMAERIAACKAMVLGKTHGDLTADATLFPSRLKKRATSSILDSHGLRVYDKDANGKEVVIFFCLAGDCGKNDCSGKKIPIDTNSTAHGASHLKSILSTTAVATVMTT